MSGNPQQAPAGVPQSQRYPQATTNFMAQTQQQSNFMAEGFHVGAHQFVPQQQPQNQGANQAPPLRGGMAPTGPSTQSSTPPNTDIKVSHVPALSYPPPRPSTYYRQQPPPSQRMMNTRQVENQQLYQNQSQYLVQTMPPHGMMVGMQFYNAPSSQRPFLPANYQIIPSSLAAAASFPTTYQGTPPHQYFYGQTQGMLRQQHPPNQVQQVPQNMTHPPQQSVPMTQASYPNNANKNKGKQRPNAIPIVNPTTGKRIDDEEEDVSHSGDSSARQTPHLLSTNSSKEVQAIQASFAKQVTQRLNDDGHEEPEQVNPVDNRVEASPPPHPNFHFIHPNRNEFSSKPQVQQKDFVPANQTLTAKETPVVSAVSNAVEVTIKNNTKDRESPAKNRKQRDNVQRESNIKEVSKEAGLQMEKGIKDEKQKEHPVPVVTPLITQVKVEVKEKEAPREEKKIQKKDKLDSNLEASNVDSTEIVPEAVPTLAAISTNQDNVKSKHGTQRNKDTSKQSGGAPPGNGKQTGANVPPSQPSKPNNKTNKMKELNIKGANKEGTDMDAFNDNSDAINANIVNTETVTIESTTVSTENANITDSNKKSESNDIPTIKPEIKTLPKNRIDITDIVKDIPKPFVPPMESKDKDEPDRASNNKLVQAKNEVNASKMSLDDDSMKFKITLPYKDDQWSPQNPSGEKKYSKDFLIALRNDPKCKKKPDHQILKEITPDRASDFDYQRFANTNSARTASQRLPIPRKGSQQGSKVGGNSKGGKSNSMIRVSISFKEDVKLHQTENAWKPSRKEDSTSFTDEEKKTEDLYKRVRSILNKLTPQKFNTLLTQIKTLPIDTQDRLHGVMDLVFEKAVDEPNFSVAYALMCREIALIQVPVSADRQEFVNFRKLLITRCQREFEQNSSDETKHNDKLKELEECTDPEKKKELLLIIEEEERRVRMKSVGNIRFIGELFKQEMLTDNIMLRCLSDLLENQDEERLECLCKLLSTIGSELSRKKKDLSDIFNKMKEITKTNTKISSRVRFMLQDVIDLRNNNWVPRRTDMNPKTIDQIQKEADNEHLNIQTMNSNPNTPRKDDRMSGLNSDKKRNNRNANEEGWVTTARTKNLPTSFTFQSDKLRVKHPNSDEPLGTSGMFGPWSRGSNIQTSNQPKGNMYAPLEKFGDSDNKLGQSRPSNKDIYNSKGSSYERMYQFDGRGSRSGSRNRSNESSHRSTPTLPQVSYDKGPPTEPAQVIPTLSPEQLKRKIMNTLNEYLGDCCNIQETVDDIVSTFAGSALEEFLLETCSYVLDKTKTARVKSGILFSHLLKKQQLQMDTYCNVLEKGFELAEDYIVDMPNLWQYYAEIISTSICEETFPLRNLHKCCKVIEPDAPKLIEKLFAIVIKDSGPNFLTKIWKKSNLSFQDFIPSDEVESYIAENKFEFLMGRTNDTPVVQSDLTLNQIEEKLLHFLQSDAKNDDITGWIQHNVGEGVKDKKFVRLLSTLIIENSIGNSKVNQKLDITKLHNYNNILSRYVDNNQEYELQCLYAVQSLVNKLDHPQGLLLAIFNTLYEDTIISYDTFIAWENCKDPHESEKKGVAMKQLTSFFTQLKENDDESTSGSEE